MDERKKARILRKDEKHIIYIPSFELEISEHDIALFKKGNIEMKKKIKLMELELSLNKTKIDKLTKENKKWSRAYAKKLKVLK